MPKCDRKQFEYLNYSSKEEENGKFCGKQNQTMSLLMPDPF